MRHIRHAITQAFLLNKRILKQPVFLILLALVPMLVLGVNLISFETGSLVTVAVAPGSHDDSSARALISTLVHSVTGLFTMVTELVLMDSMVLTSRTHISQWASSYSILLRFLKQ